jgi:hypothetical protein
MSEQCVGWLNWWEMMELWIRVTIAKLNNDTH